jgi:uncharacterized protein (TIGR03083 family)
MATAETTEARKAAIREELVGAQRALLDELDRVPAERWAASSPNEGWLVRDLLAHLSTSETGFLSTLRRMASGQGGVPDDFDINRWNAGQVRRRGETSVADLRASLEEAHEQIVELLASLDDTALDQRGRMSIGQQGSTEDTFRLLASHKREHTAQIAAART